MNLFLSVKGGGELAVKEKIWKGQKETGKMARRKSWPKGGKKGKSERRGRPRKANSISRFHNEGQNK